MGQLFSRNNIENNIENQENTERNHIGINETRARNDIETQRQHAYLLYARRIQYERFERERIERERMEQERRVLLYAQRMQHERFEQERVERARQERAEQEHRDTVKKAYGYYHCSCGGWWESAHSWATESQKCKKCGEDVYPYRQEELQPKNEEDYGIDPKKSHREDLCGMCKKLGRSCTLIMSASGNARYPNDVVVRGLPMDINEPQLRRQFSQYGEILRVNIPAPRDGTHSRIAFITFYNREAAMQRFYEGEYGEQRHRLRLT